MKKETQQKLGCWKTQSQHYNSACLSGQWRENDAVCRCLNFFVHDNCTEVERDMKQRNEYVYNGFICILELITKDFANIIFICIFTPSTQRLIDQIISAKESLKQ